MALKQKQIIEALQKNAGYISKTAKALGVSYQAIRDRIKKDPKLAAAYEAINEEMLDFSESKLLAAVREGEAWAICFHLKCKGKNRGWVERQEITGVNGEPVTLRVIYDEKIV